MSTEEFNLQHFFFEIFRKFVKKISFDNEERCVIK